MIAIVDTGIANVASVEAALVREGVTPIRVSRPEQIASADRLVLPGVGAFAAALHTLDPLREALLARIAADRPTLGICLGLQVLALASEESPGAEGLGVLPATVHRFPDSVRVPQLGWNTVDDGCDGIEPGAYYFANSYRLAATLPGWQAARAHHGGSFIAAVRRGAVWACQFHPELSGARGARLLQRWLSC